MSDLASFLAYLLSSMGLTILIVWPKTGPSAFLRERFFRPALPAWAREALDCYICCGFWAGLLLTPIWFAVERRLWCCTGCLMVPSLFWIILRPGE